MRGLIFCSLLFFLHSGYSQLAQPVEFGPPIVDTHDMVTVDFDNDGDLDICSHQGDQGTIALLENLGEGEFETPQIILTMENHRISFFDAGDMDNDGDTDLLIELAEFTDQGDTYRLSLFRNNGNQQFEEEVLMGHPSNRTDVELADFNGDADLDIGFTAGVFVCLMLQEDSAMFAEPDTVFSYDFPFRDIFAGDVNSDTLPDLIVSSSAHNSTVLINNPGLQFEELFQTFVQSDYTLLRPADIDGDGDIDLYAKKTYQYDAAWWENTGNGYTFNDIETVDFNEKQLEIFDIDGDGDQDCIVSFEDINGNVGTYIVEYTNGGFSENMSFVEGRIYEQLIAVNVDNDSDIDIITFNSDRQEIGLMKNTGQGDLLSSRELTESIASPYDFFAFDWDGDGLKDLMMSTNQDHKVSWYKNLGNGNYSDQRVVTNKIPDVGNIWPTDVNNDGSYDLLWTIRPENNPLNFLVAWSENHEDEGFGEPNPIIEKESKSIVVEDFDDDDDLDIIHSSLSPSNYFFQVYENTGTGSFEVDSFPTEIFQGARGDMLAADLDGDNDLDVVTTTGLFDVTIGWFENFGNLEFSDYHILDTLSNPELASGMIEDFDLDGDSDILCGLDLPGDDNYSLILMRNNGDGTFADADTVVSGSPSITSTVFIDVDGDGLRDILMSYNSGNIFVPGITGYRYSKNLGNGQFDFPLNILQTNYPYIAEDASDVDMDGDMDILALNHILNKTYIIENLYFQPQSARGYLYFDNNQNGVRDSTETGLPFLGIESVPASAYVHTFDDGRYVFSFDEAEPNTYTLIPQIPEGWTITSDSLSYSFEVDQSFTVMDSLDFGFFLDSNFTQISANLVGGFPRCNTSVNYWMQIGNEGTNLPSGTVHLELDANITFLGSDVEPDSIDGQIIYWHFDSLDFFAAEQFIAYVEMPDFNQIGEELTSYLQVDETDAQGEVLTTYSDTLTQILNCAYDPNDKAVSPLGLDSVGYIWPDEDLNYLIRFQNTGNDTAISVVIEDQLSPQLDLSTFEPVASSHEMQTYLQADGHLEFAFYNIMLPDSNIDFLGSQGFVKFRIQPMEGLLPNTEILNTAEIFFDYNPAIVTNTVQNTIICYIAPMPLITFDGIALQAGDVGQSYQWFLNNELIEGANSETWIPEENGSYTVEITDENGCSTLSTSFNFSSLNTKAANAEDISIYPNPSSDLIFFDLSSMGNQPLQLSVFDLSGKIVFMDSHAGGSVYSMSKAELGSGVFVLSVSDSKIGEVLTTGRFIIR